MRFGGIMLTADEVAKHNSRRSCWVIIAGQAYDVTDFLDNHPGGPSIILRYAGIDATAEYQPVHPEGTIERELSPDKHLGQVDPSTIATNDSLAQDHAYNAPLDVMPLSVCQNLDDLENIARTKLSRRAWTYFNSAADSLHSLHTNRNDWSKISFRPRVLRNVERVNMQRVVMGHKADHPFFIAPAALAKLGHPEGEICLARGAADKNIVYCASTYSSVAHDQLTPAFKEKGGGALSFQLYVPRQKEDAKTLIQQAKKLGCTALVVTVDTPVVGKREEDERYKAEIEYVENGQVARTSDPEPGGEKPVLRGHHNYTIDWNDITWMQREWGHATGPFILKGIQTAEDALKAAQRGVDGIYLSNHGGRQLDFAPSSIRTLLEIRKFHPEVLRKLEVYLDGGVRRGTDIIKALALGARGVGLGRPFLYALSAYGTEGVRRAIELLSEEIETTLRLLGVTCLNELDVKYLNCTILERELPSDAWFRHSDRLEKL